MSCIYWGSIGFVGLGLPPSGGRFNIAAGVEGVAVAPGVVAGLASGVKVDGGVLDAPHGDGVVPGVVAGLASGVKVDGGVLDAPHGDGVAPGVVAGLASGVSVDGGVLDAPHGDGVVVELEFKPGNRGMLKPGDAVGVFGREVGGVFRGSETVLGCEFFSLFNASVNWFILAIKASWLSGSGCAR